MTTKFTIKLGVLEVGYEGDQEYSKADLLALLQELRTVQKELPTKKGSKGDDSDQGSESTDAGSLSASEIAQKLSVSSGPELVMAAAAKAIIVDKHDTVTRKTILAAMQSASSYYKASYSGNLGKILKRLVLDNQLNEINANTYSLNVDARKALVTKLA
jgi:hypothetical protein